MSAVDRPLLFLINSQATMAVTAIPARAEPIAAPATVPVDGPPWIPALEEEVGEDGAAEKVVNRSEGWKLSWNMGASSVISLVTVAVAAGIARPREVVAGAVVTMISGKVARVRLTKFVPEHRPVSTVFGAPPGLAKAMQEFPFRLVH